jgi:hypothetical protein
MDTNVISTAEILSKFQGPIGRAEALSPASPLPRSAGVYLWYFKDIPPGVPALDCYRAHDAVLLYAGISPDHRAKPNSKQSIRSRAQYHLKGNAEGSTLRRTLGILLSEISGFPLQRVGSGKRMTLTHAGEQWLDHWLDQHAIVCWHEMSDPWLVEEAIIRAVSCPLNIQNNDHHPFNSVLRKRRMEALAIARSAPIAAEHGQVRRASERLD